MARKTSQLNMRIDPELKRRAAKAAAEDHRPLGSLVSVLLDKHCRSCDEAAPPPPKKADRK